MATQFCTRCKKTKTLDQFTLKRDGQSYWAQCTLCRHKGSGHELDGTTKPRKPKAHTLDETLPLTPLADFLNYLTAQNTDLDLETRLSIPTLSGFTTTKEKAEELKTMINAVIPYRFMFVIFSFFETALYNFIHSYRDKREHASGEGMTYRFHCAQDDALQKKSQKTASESKQRDKISMDFFPCESRLSIVFSDSAPSVFLFIFLYVCLLTW